MTTSCCLFSDLQSFLLSFMPPALTVWKAPYPAPLRVLLAPVPIAALPGEEPQGLVPQAYRRGPACPSCFTAQCLQDERSCGLQRSLCPAMLALAPNCLDTEAARPSEQTAFSCTHRQLAGSRLCVRLLTNQVPPSIMQTAESKLHTLYGTFREKEGEGEGR